MSKLYYINPDKLTDKDKKFVEEVGKFVDTHKIAENKKENFMLFRIYEDIYRQTHSRNPTIVSPEDLESIKNEYGEKLKKYKEVYKANHGCEPKTVKLSDLENIQVEQVSYPAE
jgi:hypothetical protein